MGSLVDSFVGEGIGMGDDIDVVVFVDEVRYDIDFVLVRGDDIGVVGVNEMSFGLGFEYVGDVNYV